MYDLDFSRSALCALRGRGRMGLASTCRRALCPSSCLWAVAASRLCQPTGLWPLASTCVVSASLASSLASSSHSAPSLTDRRIPRAAPVAGSLRLPSSPVPLTRLPATFPPASPSHSILPSSPSSLAPKQVPSRQ